VLWTLLYESAARAGEVLGLDVDELDVVNRRAVVTRKGGARDVIVWQSGTARLLAGSRRGPVLLTDRRAAASVALLDLDPGTGRARLSYRRAAELLELHTADLPAGPYTLHQLRHSALTHAAEQCASTPMLMALSGHLGPVTGRLRPRLGRGPGQVAGPARSRRSPPVAQRNVMNRTR
jgi:integrase/recombinase XerC/integrase/recombinase XerD